LGVARNNKCANRWNGPKEIGGERGSNSYTESTVFPRILTSLDYSYHIDVDGDIVTATLNDSGDARDFAALLPLSMTLKNFAEIERIAYLPRELSVAGTSAGTSPRVGDITYNAPWGNLAIFAGNDSYARGLVRLSKVDTGLPASQRLWQLEVRIDRIEE
jgi:hypothetical protein